jgi:hypothetical protein
MIRSTLLILSAGVLVAACAPPKPAAPASPVVRYSAEADFASVRDDLQSAILAKGLVIDNTSFIASMLERTGKDVGSTQAIFAADHGQAFSFCSAVLSRKTMEADAHNIAFCPYALVVYSTAAEPKKVYVAYRRLALPEGSELARAALRDVETLLDGIAREALRLKDDKK